MTRPPLLRGGCPTLPRGPSHSLHESSGARENGGAYRTLRARKYHCPLSSVFCPLNTRLSKPDGLAAYGNGIVVSQESGQSPLLWWNEGQVESWPIGDNIEGISIDGHTLFAVEDVKRNGRLLEYDLKKKEMKVLRDGLDEAEGVALCPDGGLFFSEKRKGWIKHYTPGPSDAIVIGGLRDPGFLMCNDEGLWISEDSHPEPAGHTAGLREKAGPK